MAGDPGGTPTVCDTLVIRGPDAQPEKERLIFRRTAAETGGALLEMDAHYAPGGQYPPDHFHPRQDEHFAVLAGEVQVRIAGQERTYRAGESFDVPRGTVHSMRNGGDTPASVRWQTRPALATETLYETLFGLIGDGKTNAHGIPNPLQLAVLLRDYVDVFVLASPPPPVQRALVGLLAPLGRLLGYRGRYDRYSGRVVRADVAARREA